MPRKMIMAGFAGLVAAGLASFSAAAAETIKIGLIEPLSGPIAAVGNDALQAFEFNAERVNARGGVLGGRHLEIVPLDNAMNAEKTTQQLKKAVDLGLSYIIQGIGSNHALNIIKFVNKHNKRNPDKAILYLNQSAVTTAFPSRCRRTPRSSRAALRSSATLARFPMDPYNTSPAATFNSGTALRAAMRSIKSGTSAGAAASEVIPRPKLPSPCSTRNRRRGPKTCPTRASYCSHIRSRIAAMGTLTVSTVV